MANENQSDRLRFPEYFLSDLMHKSVREEIANKNTNPTIFKQALVLAVDVFGGKLQNPEGQGSLTQMISGRNITINASKGPINPRNSIKARILTDGQDQFVGDEDLTIFYPLLPENSLPPIKPGEHALVLFLDENNTQGLWVSKYPGVDGVNFTVGEKNFKSDDNKLTNLFPGLKKDSSEEENLATDEAASESSISGNNLTELFK